MNKLEKLLAEKDSLVLDGAMGTMLFAQGLEPGAPPEMLNSEAPQKVRNVHQAYVDAGSDIILTNSFGSTSFRLKLHNLQDQVFEINRDAARVARDVADATTDRTVLVAGSMGPSGELMVPMGEMTYESCKQAFADQAEGLAAGGADIIWIETMSDLDEVKAAIEGAQSVCDLPICATLSFDTNGRSMMGVTGRQAMLQLQDTGVTAIGANCGNNLPESLAAVAEMRSANPDMPLIAKANAGIPVWEGANLVYSGTPDVMASYSVLFRDRGARLIGGCCGSDPTHINRMKQALAGEIEVSEPMDVIADNAVKDKPKRVERTRRRKTQQ